MAEGYTLPAPGGGLNLIDGNFVGAISELEATELVNLFPVNKNRVQLRGGLEDYCDTSEAAAVEGLHPLHLQSGTTKLLAAVNNTLQEVSTGTTSDVTGSTTPTSDEWVSQEFNNRLFLANGANTVQVYNGSTVADSTFTGVALADLISVSSYKERLYFIEKNTASFWYGGTQSITGSLTEFDLQSVFNRGGYLLFAGSFTNQVADTSSDLFMAVSSKGEVLFYSGSDPGDSSWSLVARYEIGTPLGRRAFIRVDNDVWIITEQGIIPVSLLFSGGSTVALNAVSRKINPRIQQYAELTNSHRWHGLHYPKGKRVYIVIPISTTDSRLVVINTETGAWCDYTFGTAGMALSLGLMNGIPYAGDSAGVVRKFEQNRNDDGEVITYALKLPFNFFGARARLKAFKEIRPLIRAKSGLDVTLTLDTDFQDSGASSTISTGTGTSTPWGSSWGSSWGSGAEYQFSRYSVQGQGHSAAIRIEGSAKDTPLEINAIEIGFEIGGRV